MSTLCDKMIGDDHINQIKSEPKSEDFDNNIDNKSIKHKLSDHIFKKRKLSEQFNLQDLKNESQLIQSMPKHFIKEELNSDDDSASICKESQIEPTKENALDFSLSNVSEPIDFKEKLSSPLGFFEHDTFGNIWEEKLTPTKISSSSDLTEDKFCDEQSSSGQLHKNDESNFWYEYKALLEKTVKSHSGENNFHISLLDFTAAQERSLKRRVKVLSNELHQCEICGFKTRIKGNLKRHMNTHDSNSYTSETFPCEICNFKTHIKANLKRHMKTHNSLNNFHCNYCDYKASESYHLKRHMKTHTREKIFKCEYCDYKASENYHLQRHIKTHTGQKDFHCTFCDYKSHLKSLLKLHLKKHTGEKDFVCNLCNYKAAQKAHLKLHLKIHSGERDFKCSECDYRAITNANLNRHMKIHCIEKELQCEDCEYKTSHRSSLKRHIKLHKSDKNMQCHLCDYQTYLKNALKRHMKIHS